MQALLIIGGPVADSLAYSGHPLARHLLGLLGGALALSTVLAAARLWAGCRFPFELDGRAFRELR